MVLLNILIKWIFNFKLNCNTIAKLLPQITFKLFSTHCSHNDYCKEVRL